MARQATSKAGFLGVELLIFIYFSSWCAALVSTLAWRNSFIFSIMGLLTIMTLLVAFISVSLLRMIFLNIPPTERKMQQQVREMRVDMEKWAGELVPIDKKELELLSMSQIKQVRQKRWTNQAKGIFTTIYNEPIVAYSYRKFLGRGGHAILYARSADHEFAYWIRSKDVRLVIDNKLVGIYKKGTLLGARSGKPIAQFQEEKNALLPLRINDREVGSLIAAPAGDKKNLSRRAFEFLRDDISEDEETLLLSLAVLELVHRSVD